MNTFKVSAVALATTIALVGCGGSKKSSSDDKPKVYTSKTCMDKTDIINAEIDLKGITFETSCLNDKSTKDHYIIEGPTKSRLKFIVSQDVQLQKLAEMYSSVKPHQLKNLKAGLKEVRSKAYTEGKWTKFETALKNKDMKSIKQSIKSLEIDRVYYIDTVVKNGSNKSNTDRMDYSLNVKFEKTGEYKEITYTARSVNKDLDKATFETSRILSRTEFAKAYNPLTAKLSFLIKDPEAEKKDDKQPEKKDDKQPGKKDGK